jgi:hypothetical protein
MRREVEVDTKLAELHGRLAQVHARLESDKLTLARFAGAKTIYETRTRRVVRETADELIAGIEELLETERIASWDVRRANETIERYRALETERQAILDEMKPLNDEFAAKPWSRFFLVQNHGGHIHSTMSCSTCRATTVFGWLPQLSGLTEKDAVEAHGPLLCSICYPSAPVEWTLGAAPKDDPDRCPGSGQYAENAGRRRYVECGTCGKVIAVTPTHKLRAHKREEVKV